MTGSRPRGQRLEAEVIWKWPFRHQDTSWPSANPLCDWAPRLSTFVYTHILLSGQSTGRKQWTASGTLRLNGRAVSMEEAVGCAATRILPLRSQWLAPSPMPGPGTVSGATTCSSQQWGLTQAVQVVQSRQPGLAVLSRVSFEPGLFSHAVCVTHSPPPCRHTTTSPAHLLGNPLLPSEG